MALKHSVGRVYFFTSGVRGLVTYNRFLSSSALLVKSSTVGVARLKTLNLPRLRSREATEVDTLRTACEEDGFFYLDLRRDYGGQMLQDWTLIKSLMERWFTRPLDNKMKYHCGTVLHGYRLHMRSEGGG